MKTMLTRFAAWAPTHANAPCPTPGEIGAALNDPWNTPIVLTCVDQPETQTVGLRSAGPDRALGTQDDIVSWAANDPALVDLVNGGARWTSVAAKPATKKRAVIAKRPSSTPVEKAAVPPVPAKTSIELDKYGAPIKR
jgi:hypothetical protein